jgi:hypothetical protein
MAISEKEFKKILEGTGVGARNARESLLDAVRPMFASQAEDTAKIEKKVIDTDRSVSSIGAGVDKLNKGQNVLIQNTAKSNQLLDSLDKSFSSYLENNKELLERLSINSELEKERKHAVEPVSKAGTTTSETRDKGRSGELDPLFLGPLLALLAGTFDKWTKSFTEIPTSVANAIDALSPPILKSLNLIADRVIGAKTPAVEPAAEPVKNTVNRQAAERDVEAKQQAADRAAQEEAARKNKAAENKEARETAQQEKVKEGYKFDEKIKGKGLEGREGGFRNVETGKVVAKAEAVETAQPEAPKVEPKVEAPKVTAAAEEFRPVSSIRNAISSTVDTTTRTAGGLLKSAVKAATLGPKVAGFGAAGAAVGLFGEYLSQIGVLDNEKVDELVNIGDRAFIDYKDGKLSKEEAKKILAETALKLNKTKAGQMAIAAIRGSAEWMGFAIGEGIVQIIGAPIEAASGGAAVPVVQVAAFGAGVLGSMAGGMLAEKSDATKYAAQFAETSVEAFSDKDKLNKGAESTLGGGEDDYRAAKNRVRKFDYNKAVKQLEENEDLSAQDKLRARAIFEKMQTDPFYKQKILMGENDRIKPEELVRLGIATTQELSAAQEEVRYKELEMRRAKSITPSSAVVPAQRTSESQLETVNQSAGGGTVVVNNDNRQVTNNTNKSGGGGGASGSPNSSTAPTNPWDISLYGFAFGG